MPRLYFIRHGQSEANLLRQISNRGWRHPLTPLGEQQAAALAERLAGEGITGLYASPLQRAVQTAHILGARLGLPVSVQDGLREFDCGELEGRSDEAAWKRYAWLGDEWRAGRWDARQEGGESLNDMRCRFLPLIEHLTHAPELKNARLALVGHGGLFIWMLPFVLPPEMSLPQDWHNTQYIEVEL